MLKTISPLISPELLKVLAEMGHGDEIIFSDAHFPAHSMGPQVIRADGLLVSDLLQAIIPLFELDSYAPPLMVMVNLMLCRSANLFSQSRNFSVSLSHSPPTILVRLSMKMWVMS